MEELDDRTFVASFQALDRAIINPWFMLTGFMGAPVVTAAAAVLVRDEDAFPWVAAAFAAYLGIRISPLGVFNGLDDHAGQPMGLHLAGEFARREIGLLHLSEPDWAGGAQLDDEFHKELRTTFPGVLVGAGNCTVRRPSG